MKAYRAVEKALPSKVELKAYYNINYHDQCIKRTCKNKDLHQVAQLARTRIDIQMNVM